MPSCEHVQADDEGDDDGDDLFGFDDFSDAPGKRPHSKPHKLVSRGAWYGLEGDTLVVHLRAESARAKMQWAEIVRHTPVTGFAPGLAGTLTVYDSGDRAHLLLDGAVNINTRRHSVDATGGTFLERLNAQERVDWLAGSRIRVPALGIAELGGQIHTLTDTADKWRISPMDSSKANSSNARNTTGVLTSRTARRNASPCAWPSRRIARVSTMGSGS